MYPYSLEAKIAQSTRNLSGFSAPLLMYNYYYHTCIPVFYNYRYNIDIFTVVSRVTPTIIYYSRNYPCSNKIVNDNDL